MLLVRRAFRSVKSNFKAYFSIFIISLLSVMLFTGLSSNYHFLKDNVSGAMNDSNLADYYVTTTHCSNYDLEELSKDKYKIDLIEERLYVDSYIKERKIYLSSYSDTSTMGLYSHLDGTEGVMITESFARRRKLKIGDEVDVVLKTNLGSILPLSESFREKLASAVKDGHEDIINDADEFSMRFQITGIMNHGESLGNMASDVGMLLVSDSILKDSLLAVFNECYQVSKLGLMTPLIPIMFKYLNITNQYLIRGGDELAIRRYFTEKADTNFLIMTSKENMPGVYTALSDVSQAKSLCYVFPIVFYISALLIIVAAIDKMISDDHLALGLMGALGREKKEIISYYSLVNSIQVLLGAIVGMILGPLVFPRVMNIKYASMYSLREYKHAFIYPSYILIFLLLIVFVVLVTMAKCFKYLSAPAKDVMQSAVAKKHKKSILSKILPKRAFSLKMALRNIWWNKMKSLLVVIGVLGCTSLLLCGFGIEDTLNYGLEKEIGERLDYDIEVSYNHTMIGSNDIKSRDSRINYAEEYAYSLVTLEYNDSMLDTIMNVVDSNSKCININLSADGATLSEKLASYLNVSEGDTIGLYSSGHKYSVKIASITSMFFAQGIYVPREVAEMPYENNRCMLLCDDGSDLKEVSQAIKLNGESSSVTGIFYARTKETRYNNANKNLSSLRLITGMIKGFAILLCIAVIYNLVSMNYNERIRDMATLKSLGYGYKENALALVLEISILTIVGSLLGLVFGMPFLKEVLGLNEPPNISFIYRINISSYFMAVFMTIGISAILNLLISIKIKDVDMVKNLKVRE